MAMQEVNDLLRSTVARVTELYETRPMLPTGFGDLSPFTGDPNDLNWSKWERKFSRLAILTGATTLSRKTALLANYLRGAALNYFGELEARQPPLANWNAWTAAYLTKFPDNRQIDVKYEQLIARTQSPGESVAVFAADVRRLAKRAFPTCNGAGEPNKIVENHFTNQLIPNICHWMKNAEPESFEAVTEAEKEEFREKQYHGENNLSFQVLANSANQLMNLVQQISAVNLAGNSNAKRRNELRTSQHDDFNQFPRQDDRFWPRNNARDLFAQLFGPQEPNWMGSCPNRAHNNYNCGRPSGRCSDGTVSCFRCGRMGHYSSTCPMLEREENSRFLSSTRSSWRSGPSRVQMPARGVSNPRSPGDALSGTRGVNSQLLVVPEANGPNVSNFNSDTIAEQLDPWNCDDYDLPIENSSARPQAHICMARYNEDFCFETGPNSALVSGGTGSIEIGDNPTTASHRFTGNNFEEDPDDFGYSASVRSFEENCGATEFDYNEERQRCRQQFWGTNGIPGQVESASVFTDTAQTGGYNSNHPSESRAVGVVFCLNGPVAAARVCNLCDISNCKHMQDFESQSRQREIARQGPLEFTTERWINESIPWIVWRPEVTSMEHLMQSQSILTDSRIDRGRPENLHFRYRAEAVCRNWKLNRRRSPRFDFQQIWRSSVSSMTSYFWFIILLALSFLFGYAVDEPFYQCGASRGGRTSMESKTMRCNSPPLIAVEKQEFKVHIQSTNRHLNQIPAVRCVLRNRTVCMNTRIFGSKGIVSDTTSQNIVTPGLCRQVWIDKNYREQGSVEIQPGVWTTNQTLQVEFKWYCKGTCRSVQNLLLKVGTIAAVDNKSTISDLGDTGGCPPIAGQCFNTGGMIIWNTKTFKDYCPLASVGKFTGQILQDQVIVEEGRGAFQLSASISTSHLRNAYSTEQGPILQFGEDIHQLLMDRRSSNLKFELVEKDLMNSKLQCTTREKNLITTTDYLVSGPLQLILNLLIVLIIVIVLCIIMYFIFRRYIINRIGQCFHRSHQRSDQELIIRFSDLQNHEKEEERREEVQDTPEEPVNVETAYSMMLKKASFPWLSGRTLPKNESVASNCNAGLRFSHTQDQCPMINVWLNEDVDNPVTTLADSGSDISLLEYDLAVKRGFLMLKPMIQRYKVVNSQTAEVIASCWIQISLTIPQKLSAPPEFLRVHVVKDSTYNLLLETDYLRRFAKVELRWKAARINFGTIIVPMKNPKIFRPDPTRGIVVLAETVTIPPRAIHFVNAQWEAPYSQINALVFEPLMKFLTRYHLQVASCLFRPDESLILVGVLNPTESHTALYQGTKIGKVRVYQHLYSDQPIACEAHSNQPPQSLPSAQFESAFSTSNIDMKNANLNPDQRRRFFSLLARFATLFTVDENDLGRTTLTQHRINTSDYVQIDQILYCVPYKHREQITEEITKMAEKGIVTPSQSPWASPVVLVPKKTGGYRLDTTTNKDNYPLLRTDDIFDAVHGATPFTTLDQARGYWQILLAKDKEKTVFITYNRLYEFSVVPLGLCNTPATFQHLMNLVLSESQWSSCPVSRDDVSTRKTFDDNLIYLEEAFQQLQGQEIPAQGIKPDENKVNSFKNFTVPTNVDQLRSFPRLASYYRRFVQNFAKIAHPLHCLLKSAQKYEWTKVCQQVFVTLKERLNATNDRLGAVLSQNVEDREKPINTSRSLSQAERTCAIIEQEASTVIGAVKYFNHYLYQQRVTVFTDHSALQDIFSKPKPSRRMARWGLALQEFQESNIKHRAGRINKNKDALSRNPEHRFAETKNVKFNVNAITHLQTRKEKLKNPNSTIAEVGLEKTPTIVRTSINNSQPIEAKVPKNAPTERIWSKFEEKGPTIEGTIDEEAQTIVSESIEIEKNASEIEKFREGRENDPFCRRLLTNLQRDHLPEDLKLAKKIILLAPQLTIRNKLLYYVDEAEDNKLKLKIIASRNEEIYVRKHCLSYVGCATRKTTSKKNRARKKHPTYTQRSTNSLNQPLQEFHFSTPKKSGGMKETTAPRAMTQTDAEAEATVKMISAEELENFSTGHSKM